ncbi:MAG: hypothetical protein A4E24_00760 [Methanomethylovorans sp. PtaU1.Bin093]|nr:MAG: hypothetical protein A4E24_00760 [Methanomethylovorans sp. PtaU1.Bin093]
MFYFKLVKKTGQLYVESLKWENIYSKYGLCFSYTSRVSVKFTYLP